jgi:hypothetical protein
MFAGAVLALAAAPAAPAKAATPAAPAETAETAETAKATTDKKATAEAKPKTDTAATDNRTK